MHPSTIAILDFGGQYVQLIARRVRENQVHSVIVAPNVTADELRAHGAVGLILSGGPASVYQEGAPRCREPSSISISTSRVSAVSLIALRAERSRQ